VDKVIYLAERVELVRNRESIIVGVIIRDEQRLFKMYFREKGGEVFLDENRSARDDGCLDDAGWFPPYAYEPAIKQARAIFAKYRKSEKSKAQQGQK